MSMLQGVEDFHSIMDNMITRFGLIMCSLKVKAEGKKVVPEPHLCNMPYINNMNEGKPVAGSAENSSWKTVNGLFDDKVHPKWTCNFSSGVTIEINLIPILVET